VAQNPGLEEAIEKDPDDEDAYLVYGDWLQGEGDPRGELIALQAAAMRDPTDKAIAKRVTELLARHDGDLLGALGEDMSVVWHLGFVRSARIAPDKDPSKPIDALKALLAHPSGRFVRSISFQQPKGIDAKKIVRHLLDTRTPLTLSELRIGGNWDVDTDAPQLREVFPRLNRSLDAEWRTILGTLAELRAVDVKYNIEALPRLVPLPDVDTEGVGPEHVLLGLRQEIDKHNAIGIVSALRRSFTAESLDKFALAMGQQFIDERGPANMKFGFTAIGVLGGPACVAWIGAELGNWSHQRSVQGAELLAKIGNGEAIWELFAMTTDPKLNLPRRHDAALTLQRLANERNLEVDRLLDRSVPPVLAEAKPRKGGRTSRIQDALIRRFQSLMVDGYRMPDRHFVHYFVTHPVIAPLARRMLWATYDRHDVETTFRIDEEGKALDAGGEEVDLSGATVGVLHPAELPASDRRSVLKEWKEVFSDEKIGQPFPQIERSVEELRDTDRGTSITRFKLRTVGFEQLSRFEHELDWEPSREDVDGGPPITVAWSKYFKRDGVLAWATPEQGALTDLQAHRGNQPVTFSSLHPVTASEILASAERITVKDRKKRDADDAVAESSDIEKGQRVQIKKGANRLREGVVFWIGDGNNGPRVGLRTDDNETLWANLADVRKTTGPVRDDGEEEERLDEDDAAAKFIASKQASVDVEDPADVEEKLAKGTKVRWSKGRHSGTGVVFWLGPNKFGEGMRAGIKDDETNETVWADADDCTPL
jgi:uncharacterized protein (TIGR02996 family)